MARTAAALESGGETRETILRAALRAFSEKGFAGASNRDIAAAAGVNHGLILYYFGSKLKLWQAAVDLAFADIDAELREVMAAPAAAGDRERAGSLIHAYVHFVARHPEFVRLMHEEGKRRGPRMRWLVDRHVKPLYAAVTDLLERGRAGGTLRPDIPPVHFFYLLAGAVGVIFHQAEECRRLSGTDPFAPEVVEAHARAVELFLLGPPS